MRSPQIREIRLKYTMSMITASTWVPRGYAATYPKKYDVDEIELARISKLAKLQLDDAKADFDNANAGREEPTATENSSEGERGARPPRSQGYIHGQSWCWFMNVF